MMEHLLEEIHKGGTLETHVLAAQLGVSPTVVSAMLDHLQRLGYLDGYVGCHSDCDGCSLQQSCDHTGGPRLWQTSQPH